MISKQQQRAAGRAVRKRLSPAARESANAALCAHLAQTPEFQRAHTVLLYAAFDGEPDLRGLLAYAPDKCYVWPRCISRTEFIALVPNGPDSWLTGAFGIKEPDPDRSRLFAPEALDLVLVPGTAFDRYGQRVGMGAGMYDRFLQQCPQAATLGVCYTCQLVPQVMAQPHDIPLGAVVTEDGVYRAGGQENTQDL